MFLATIFLVVGLFILSHGSISPSENEKPGICPVEVDFPMCTDEFSENECEMDSNCKGKMKCCVYKCVKRCVLLLEEKPGTCPADVDFPRCDNPAISFLLECKTDRDCKGKSKCCFLGCRNRCLLPLQDKLDSCPYFNHSICVLVKPTPSECKSDDQCQGTERCCCSNCHRQCTPTVKVKPGQCPAPKKRCPKIDPAKCKTDSNCIKNQKCCDRCGLKCVTPEKEHDGVCPTSMENLSCLAFYKTLCNRDSDCPLEQKCCLSDNVLQCQEVKKEKPGSCPVALYLCKPPILPPLCTSDRDCPGDKKCCTPECQQKCTDPFLEE